MGPICWEESPGALVSIVKQGTEVFSVEYSIAFYHAHQARGEEIAFENMSAVCNSDHRDGFRTASFEWADPVKVLITPYSGTDRPNF